MKIDELLHSSFLISWVAWKPSITGMLQSIKISLQFLRFNGQKHGFRSSYTILFCTISKASFPLIALSERRLCQNSKTVYRVTMLKMLSSTIRMSFRLLQLQGICETFLYLGRGERTGQRDLKSCLPENELSLEMSKTKSFSKSIGSSCYENICFSSS